MEPTFSFTSKIWLWDAKDAWHFATVPLNVSKQIKALELPRKGFGSVRVTVTIGNTTWKTSIFPEKKGTYVLPLKKTVRTKEQLKNGDTAKIQIAIDITL